MPPRILLVTAFSLCLLAGGRMYFRTRTHLLSLAGRKPASQTPGKQAPSGRGPT
jgi:hypothetical protein